MAQKPPQFPAFFTFFFNFLACSCVRLHQPNIQQILRMYFLQMLVLVPHPHSLLLHPENTPKKKKKKSPNEHMLAVLKTTNSLTTQIRG